MLHPSNLPEDAEPQASPSISRAPSRFSAAAFAFAALLSALWIGMWGAYLWGNFVAPMKTPCLATEGSKMHRLPPSPDRWKLRSETPQGFANAFFEANP